MEDPTRIPRVLDHLRTTWEGQPALSLPTLFGILANRGVAWGTTDDELVDALRAEALLHPADLPRDNDGRVQGHFLVSTTSPELHVTCTPDEVIVRFASQAQRQPGVWPYSQIRPTGPGRLLVLTDNEGIDHKLGVVTLISALADDAPTPHRLHREDRGNYEWLITTVDGCRHVVGHVVTSWDPQRRHVEQTSYRWATMVSCQEGEEWKFSTPQGDTISHGIVASIVVLET